MTCGQFKTSYREDMKIFQTAFVKFWLLVLLMALVLFPCRAGRCRAATGSR